MLVSCGFRDLNAAHAAFESASSSLSNLLATDTAAKLTNVPSSLDFSFRDPQLPPPLSFWYGDYGETWFLNMIRIDSKERIIAGFIRRPATQDLPAADMLVRLNPDGSFDRQTEVPFVRTLDVPRRFEPMPDGKLLLYGGHFSPTGSVRPGLICLNEDLTIDTSFILTNEFVRTLLVLPDGKFVVAREGSHSGGSLRRYHSNGSLDPTFNFAGPFVVAASALGLQSDGRLLVQYSYSILRVETNGVVDATFNVSTSLPGSYFKSQLAVGLDDSIYFEGSQGFERCFPNGQRDGSFSPKSTGVPRVDPSGRIVLFSPDRIARINADGSDDPAFAPVYSPERFVDNFYNFAIDRQSRIIVVGNFTSLAGVPRNQLARLNATNTLQGIGLAREAFLAREGGPVSFVLERTGDARESSLLRYRISPLSAQPGQDFQPREGEIAFAPLERTKVVPVILMDDSVAKEDELLLIELTALPANSIPRRLRGTLRILDNDRVRDNFDLSFGSLVPPTYSPGLRDFHAVAVQPNGKILVIDPFGASSTVQRLLPSGAPDPAFSPVDTRDRKLTDVERDGKLLLRDIYSHSLLRHNPDGTRDGSFQFPPVPGFWVRGAKTHRENGSILVYGSSSNGPAILRLTENGGRDESFRFMPPPDLVEKFDSLAQVIYESDDSIFAVADWTLSLLEGLSEHKVLRLNPDGSVDSRFKTELAPLKHLQLWAADRDGSLLLSTTDMGGERLLRQLPDGSIDPGFGPVQLYLTNAQGPLLGSVIIQPDGRILLAGSFEKCNGIPSHGILRLNPDGSLDHSFELWPNEMLGPLDHRNNAIANIVPTQREGEYLLNAMQVWPMRRGWNLSTSRGTAMFRFTTASLPHLHSISFSESGALFHADPGAYSNLSLEFSDNLRDWQPLSRMIAPAVITDQERTRHRFYRARTTSTSGQTGTTNPAIAR